MTKKEYIAKYVTDRMKGHNLPYGLQYINLLESVEIKAEEAYRKYKKRLLKGNK